ncbi:MAG TPA: hypothetical protein EYO80_07785 [Candidatus Marinimicrobia bacterium]|nr:hypothetical protein [Candidatus Neomarinimicrobiota bacterium]
MASRLEETQKSIERQHAAGTLWQGKKGEGAEKRAAKTTSIIRQPIPFPEKGKEPGVSERFADMLGPTPGKRVAGLAASAGIAGAPLGGAANVAKAGVHALNVRARLARLRANAKKAKGGAVKSPHKNYSHGGAVKSSRKKSIDGPIVRKGHTRAPHR